MNEAIREVAGPAGTTLRLKNLPDPSTSRWVVRRKAEVVAATEGGLLSVREACERYQLSLEELVSWQRAVEREGRSGLRATKVQALRLKHERTGRRATA